MTSIWLSPGRAANHSTLHIPKVHARQPPSISHLSFEVPVSNPSGIDKVDLAYAQHFAGLAVTLTFITVYGSHASIPAWRRKVAALARANAGWCAEDVDPAFQRIVAFSNGSTEQPTPLTGANASAAPDSWRRGVAQSAGAKRGAPRSRQALYLTIAQHVLEQPGFSGGCRTRDDVRRFPRPRSAPDGLTGIFPPGYRDRFGRRLATIVDHAGP